MEILIRNSKRMDGTHRFFKKENRFIRASRAVIDEANIELGDVVELRGTNGPINLKVAPAYTEDMLIDSNKPICYVTSDVMLSINGNRVGEIKQEVKRSVGITLGCDTEFFILDDKMNIVNPAKFFREFGEIGYDMPMVEIRPQPATDPITLSNNIYELIGKTAGILKPYNITPAFASNYNGNSAGFHIHFGLPKEILNDSMFRYKTALLLTYALDFYISLFSVLSENTEDINRRQHKASEYGGIGDYRIDVITFEYRSIGGHVLRDKELVEDILCLSYIVVDDIINRLYSITNGFRNADVAFDKNAIYSIYTCMALYNALDLNNMSYRNIDIYKDINKIKEIVSAIFDEVGLMLSYNKYKHNMERLKERVYWQLSDYKGV